MKKTLLIIAISLIFAPLNAQNKQKMNTKIQPPVAKIIPKKLEKHGDVRTDNYYWLNERENPEVIEYLNKENEYYQQSTAHLKEFQTQLFEEMKSRIKEDDTSVPYFYNGYFYVTRYEIGKDYPIYTRKKGSMTAPEEILFDCNEMAKGFAYFNLSGINVSEDNKWVAFGIDTVSRRQYTLQIKNIETGEILPTKIENTTGGSTWAADNETLFYTRKDEVTLRSDKIYKHKKGTNPSEDALVYFEKMIRFQPMYIKKNLKNI